VSRSACHVAAQRQPILRELGLDAQTVFTHPEIRVWRKLPDRENATLEAKLGGGGTIRLHIKRYLPARRKTRPADEEAKGIQLLERAGIATVPLVAWGHDETERSFLITEELADQRPLDKLIAEGLEFDRILKPTAHLAARLHNARLHHRDLYLCHFFARTDDPAGTPTLIDAARVRPLPRMLAGRWIVKDLAQFRYSAMQLNVPEDRLDAWMEEYARARQIVNLRPLRRRVERKAAWIARHDARLIRRQPGRNISLP
jgi:heptose I phosphotransferase